MTRLQYGSRGRRANVDSGIRRVAPTFGKQSLLTFSEKTQETIAVESEAERFVAHALSLDPEAANVRPQPYTIDLTDGRILRTAEQKAEARARHKQRGTEPVFYTPDFELTWSGFPTVIEVSLEGFEQSTAKVEKLPVARDVSRDHGVDFVHIVVPSYWRHPLLANVPALRRATLRADLCPSAEVVGHVYQLQDAGAESLGDYCKGLSLDPRLLPVYVAFGALSVDILKYELCFSAPAAPGGGCLDHLQVLRSLAK